MTYDNNQLQPDDIPTEEYLDDEELDEDDEDEDEDDEDEDNEDEDDEDEDDEIAAVLPLDIPLKRVGFVALVGKPNVGKSTLLNRLLGEKVAIVSPRPQTTRVPLRGILTRADAQIIFIDTPGIHQPDHELGQFMVKLAQRTIPEADIICMMVDITSPPRKLDREIANQLRSARVPRLLVLNKIDLRPRPGAAHTAPAANAAAYRELGRGRWRLRSRRRRATGWIRCWKSLWCACPKAHRSTRKTGWWTRPCSNLPPRWCARRCCTLPITRCRTRWRWRWKSGKRKSTRSTFV
ncbi:MAG: GTPase Era [Chloroflexaceae bacterium]|nr:GTPase Era [Chloroflexaceae bacterium]